MRALIHGAYGKRGLDHFWSRNVLAPVLFVEGIFYKLERFDRNSYKIRSLVLISYQMYHFFCDSVIVLVYLFSFVTTSKLFF